MTNVTIKSTDVAMTYGSVSGTDITVLVDGEQVYPVVDTGNPNPRESAKDELRGAFDALHAELQDGFARLAALLEGKP